MASLGYAESVAENGFILDANSIITDACWEFSTFPLYAPARRRVRLDRNVRGVAEPPSELAVALPLSEESGEIKRD